MFELLSNFGIWIIRNPIEAILAIVGISAIIGIVRNK